MDRARGDKTGFDGPACEVPGYFKNCLMGSIRVGLRKSDRSYVPLNMPTPVISVSHLGKRYGSTVAVDDVSLEVYKGEIFGLIGPNGAGKTTTMECVEGLRKADQGTISVLGLDPRRDASALQKRIGVQHQEAHLQKRIKVWEAIDLWSSLYPRVVDTEAATSERGCTGEVGRRAGDLDAALTRRSFT